jgi:signal peptidase I
MSSTLPVEPQATRPARLRATPLRAFVVVAALGAAGFVFGYLGSWPPFATVMSDSMSPTIRTGDVVVLKALGGLPRVGDVVKVTVPDAARSRYGYPPVVVHRVVSVSADGTITTKGDARSHPDPFSVKRDAVSARVVTHIPAAGRVIAFLMSPMGLLWIAGGAVMLFVLPALERRHEAERAEQEALDAMRLELHAISEELARLRVEPAVQPEPQPAEEEPMPSEEPMVTEMPVVDWTDLETMDEPHWPEPEEFLPGYVPVGREIAYEPQPEPPTYVVRRRSGGLLARLR